VVDRYKSARVDTGLRVEDLNSFSIRTIRGRKLSGAPVRRGRANAQGGLNPVDRALDQFEILLRPL